MMDKLLKCDICLKDEQDEPIYGKFIEKHNMSVHYYCLLSATDLPQNGKLDISGIYGFLTSDIAKHIEKIKNKVCIYCKEANAAVNCSINGCKNTWHYICGFKNNCITQFIGQFLSFCDKHVPDQNVIKPTRAVFCYVCREEIDTHPANLIFSKCCTNDLNIYKDMPESELQNYFNDKECVQRYTYNAGYDANCINCCNGRWKNPSLTKDQWADEMRKKGIFVPSKMATWEDDQDFKKMVKNKCGLIDCPRKNISGNVWTCHACGCLPLHLSCAKVSKPEDYLCAKCFDQTFVNMLPSTSTTAQKM